LAATGTRQLGRWLVHALGNLGGRASRPVVLAEVERLYGRCLTSEDLAQLPSRGGEPAWRNQMSVARRTLVNDGVLYPPDTFGRGVWSLTNDGLEDYRRTHAAPVPMADTTLCPTFRALANSVATTYDRGRSVRLVPGETTFTDNLLLHLALTHPRRVRVERFGSHHEADTGADWEWWVHHHRSYFGFRMQAKRLRPDSDRFALDQRAAARHPGRLQVEIFADSCHRENLPGLYCLYSDRQPGGLPAIGYNRACPHGNLDHSQWGCALLPVSAALKHVRAGRPLRSDVVLSDAWPWYRLVCQSGTANVATTVRRFFATAGHPALESHDNQRASAPPHDVRRHFEVGDEAPLEHRSRLAGVVLIDAGPLNNQEFVGRQDSN